ncbi:MAG: ABC transporter permease [Alishewanella aestuarii]
MQQLLTAVPLLWRLAMALVQRSPLRTAVCLLAIGLAFFLFGLTAAMQKSFHAGLGMTSSQRLITAHKHSRQQSLPLSYLAQIQRLPGVKAVTHRQSFGGWYQHPHQHFPQYLVDATLDLAVHPLEGLSELQQALFRSGGRMVLVGQALAARFNWQSGQQITLHSAMWPKLNSDENWQFTIAGVFRANPAQDIRDDVMLIARQHFDEEVPYARNLVGWYIVSPQPQADAAVLAVQIDQLFANSTAPTTTSSERAYAMYMVRQFGELSQIALKVSIGVVLSLLLSITLYFLHCAVENRAQLAMLAALGFSSLSIGQFLLLGCLLFCLLPAGVGLFVAGCVLWAFSGTLSALFPGIGIGLAEYVQMLLIAVGMAILSCALMMSLIRYSGHQRLREE